MPRYRYYIDMLIPEEERTAEVMLLLEILRYAQIVIVEPEYIRLPCPHGIGNPLGWLENNLGNIESFGIKAEPRRRQLP